MRPQWLPLPILSFVAQRVATTGYAGIPASVVFREVKRQKRSAPRATTPSSAAVTFRLLTALPVKFEDLIFTNDPVMKDKRSFTRSF